MSFSYQCQVCNIIFPKYQLMEDHNCGNPSETEELRKEIEELKARLAKAVEVIEFYGNKDQMHEKYLSPGGAYYSRGDDWEDCGLNEFHKTQIYHGKLAREFLEGIK